MNRKWLKLLVAVDILAFVLTFAGLWIIVCIPMPSEVPFDIADAESVKAIVFKAFLATKMLKSIALIFISAVSSILLLNFLAIILLFRDQSRRMVSE